MVKRKKKTTVVNIFVKKIWGLSLIIVGAVVLSMLAFYSASDGSFNLANDTINNPFGLSGSSFASILLTFSGLSFPIFITAIMFWGYNICRTKEISFGWLRIVLWVLGVISLSIALNFIPSMPLGGLIGNIINKKVLVNIPVFPYKNLLIIAVFTGFSFVAFNVAAGIHFAAWGRFVLYVSNIIWKFLRLVAKFAAKFVKIKNVKNVADKEEKPIKKIKKQNKERFEPSFGSNPDTIVETKESVAEKSDKKPIKTAIKINSNNGYNYPPVDILSKPKEKAAVIVNQKELDETAKELESVLQEFGVNGKIVKIRPGPVVTLYELEPSAGTKTARVIGLADDIARSMSAVSVRIAVVAGSNTIGIELPNPKREVVWLRDLVDGAGFKESKNSLNVILGKDIGGQNVYADLARMPHLLVAGTTGSGKSVGMNSMILSLLYKMTPDECRLIMIDPKMLEFSIYNGIPHLLTPVITDPAKAVLGLKWAVKEMENRYRAMAQLNVRNIDGYNKRLEELRKSEERAVRTVQTGFNMETGAPVYEEQEMDLTALPYIVVVVDEMADLMLVAGKEVEAAIQRLAQMARAAGIHLILSTQRPSVDVITGVIKANFPTRISFQVTSKIDSRTILGEQGAEQLLGMGDMLYMPSGQRPVRVHGSFVKDSEVEQIVEFLKIQKEPEYLEGVTEGELNTKDTGSVFDKTAMGGGDGGLYSQAVDLVRADNKTSISYIQRRLNIGYNKAASLVEKMEEEGVLSSPDNKGKREVL